MGSVGREERGRESGSEEEWTIHSIYGYDIDIDIVEKEDSLSEAVGLEQEGIDTGEL